MINAFSSGMTWEIADRDHACRIGFRDGCNHLITGIVADPVGSAAMRI